MRKPTRNMVNRTCFLLSGLLLTLGGCTIRRPQAPLPFDKSPPQFSHSGKSITPGHWWTVFGRKRLDGYVQQALEENYSVKAACQRVRAARAVARRTASDLLPDINGVADIQSNFGPGPDRSNYSWGLDVSYQVDLWGEIESRAEADRLRSDSVHSDYQTIALTLSADIVRTWFSLIESNAQVHLLEQQITINQQGLDLQRSRFGLGLIRSPDVLRQHQLLEATHEQSEAAKARVQILEHQLAILLGQNPQLAKYETGIELPKLPPLPNTGVPSELLKRRPDVRRDFLAFQAADRELASAISAQYPRVNLIGSLSNAAQSPENLFRDWFTSIAGQLVSPLFDGGQRRAEVERATATKCQLFNELAQTTLVAFQEVEDRLAGEKFQVKQIHHLENQLKLAGQASELLTEQYIVGDVSYLDVLNATTTQQTLQRQILSARLELLLTRVSLYLALAGEIPPVEDLPQIPQVGQEEIAPAENSLMQSGAEKTQENGSKLSTDE